MLSKVKFIYPYSNGPIPEDCNKNEQFQNLRTRDWMISVKDPDNCCIINNDYVIVYNFLYRLSI